LTRVRKVDKAILHMAVAANTVGLGVILALLAELQDAHGLPTSGLGLIAGSSFLAAFVAYLVLARYADRGHAKAMLVAGSLVGVAALVMTAYADSLWLFVVARALLGLAEGAFVPAARRVVLDWDPDRPGEVLGKIMAASVGGFLLGPVIGGLLAPRFGLRVPFLLPAAVLLAAIPVVARLRAPAPIPGVTSTSLLALLRNRAVLAGVGFIAIDFMTFGVFDAVWARLLSDRGASIAFIGVTFAAISIPLVVLGPGLGRRVDRQSPTAVAIPGLIAVLVSIVGYAWIQSPVALTGVALLHGVGSAAIAPAGSALVAAGSPPDMLARGQGLMEAVGFAVAAAAALPSGWVYETHGRGWLFGSIAGIGSIIAAAAWWSGRSVEEGEAAATP